MEILVVFHRCFLDLFAGDLEQREPHAKSDSTRDEDANFALGDQGLDVGGIASDEGELYLLQSRAITR